ncbi:hypothetical protein H8S61_04100 [Eggerthella sp. NSJ-70]|uniref:SpaA-like prealbumin fold domain-containing protein n=1 Tax=Eggerthella hominis TaxID=2763043 RepID=A0ABR7BP50_9ACTN|nr:SpaA isopeptide-forming pilin-related protein [Eggerthella hominis]MBC5583378.1 hypothetical protein [Eggerthella hominis]
MRYPLAHKAASVLMAFVLVCTCNSAALQPLAAFAAQGDGAAAAEQEALTEASEAESAGEPEAAPAGEEGPAGAAESEEGAEAPRAVSGLTVSGTWDADAHIVTWTVRMGEESAAAVDLSRYELTLSFDDRLAVERARLGDAPTGFDVSGALSPGAATYRFEAVGADLPLAPQTLTVSMRASDALLDALAAAEEAGDRLAVALDARLEVAEDAAPLFDAPAVEGRADVVLREASVGEPSAESRKTVEDGGVAEATPSAVPGDAPREGAEGSDVTNEVEQLSLGVVDFSYVDAAGATHVTPAVQTGDKRVAYDFSSVPLASIDRMNMGVDFKINKDDASRTINAGDVFRYSVPSIFTVADSPFAQDIVSPTGEVLATYTIENNQVVVAFTQTVDIEEGNVGIVGGIMCSFKLNDDKLQSDAPTDADMTLQTDGTVYTFTAPKKSTDLVGIEKTGSYNKNDATVTWTVTVGSAAESAGVPLKNIVIVDEYDRATQGEATVTGPDGDALAIEQTDAGFTYAFPADSTAVAPYKLSVTVPVENEVLDAAVNGDQLLSNTATMSSPAGSSIHVTGEPGATGTATVPKYSFSKRGTPLNSSTIAWELTVNQGGLGAANDVVVYDRLDARAAYKDKTLRLDGMPVTVHASAPDPAPSSTYAVLVAEEGGTHLLEVHIAGTVDTERRITFETEIDAPGQENESIDFPNTAWIAYQWPNGYGPGEGAFKPIDVNTDFQVAHLDKETPSYDSSTGEITWRIVPSVRTDDYESGAIADVIDDDQAYIAGSVKVVYRDAELTPDQLAGVFSYDEALKLLTFSFERAEYALNDVVIEYRTQALNFKDENRVLHRYENAANLVVRSEHGTFEAQATASRTFENKFLAKTSSYEVVDDEHGSTGYLHYRIVVNGSHMPSANLQVSDDLSALVTDVRAADGASLGSVTADEWAIAEGDRAIKVTELGKDGAEQDVTTSYDTAAWKDSRKIEAIFSDDAPTTNSYRIDLYLTLENSVLQKLHQDHPGDFVISATNSATAGSDDFAGGTPTNVKCQGAAGAGNIDNRLVAKTVDGSQQGNGVLAYRININPNGADMRNVTLTDVPDDVLSIDVGSVELHRATHDAGGAIADALGEAVDSDTWSKKLTYDAGSGGTALSVTVPDGTASYVLTYSAKVVGAAKGGKIANNVTLTADQGQTGSDTCVAEVDAGSWGWLTKKAIYKLVKADEFGGKASPIAGVTFNLYSDPEKKDLVATSVSNAKGLVAFYGLDVDATYYYDELEASSGYKTLAYDADANQFTTGAGGSNTVAGAATLNERLTSEAPVLLEKTFELEAGDALSGPRSSFRLYLYPNGFDGGKKVAVSVTGSDGSYAYAPSGDNFELVNGDAGGKLSLAGLPWGDYGLEEVDPQAGYAAYEGMKHFSVVRPADDASWLVDYAPGTGNDVGEAAAVVNEKTSITVKKTTDEDKSLEGAVLAIHEDDAGAVGNVLVNSFTNEKYSVTVGDASTYEWELRGIPVGTYWLCEDKTPHDPTVGKFEDVRFSIDVHGKLAVLNGKGTVTGSTLAVADDPNKVSVKKIDQWGKTVAGATLQLQVQNGDAWDKVGDAQESPAAGELSFDGLERGKRYCIVETAVPEGYAAASHADQRVEFTIDEYGVIADDAVDLHNGDAPDGVAGNGTFLNAHHGNNGFTLRNERIVGHAEFTKQTDDGAPLAGVKFNLYRKAAVPGAADTLVNSTSFVSGRDGKVTTVGQASMWNSVTGDWMSRGLTPGTYYFKETATHGDFVFDDADPLVTDEFTISATDGRFTWSTDAEGKVSFGDVVVVTKGNGAVANAPLDASVRVLKATAGGRALNGAVFTLTGADVNGKSVSMTATSADAGTVVEATDSAGTEHVYTTTGDGEALFGNVPAGTYIVKETVPPPGYKLSAAELTVTVKQGTASETYTLNKGDAVVNEQNEFTVSKKDAATGEALGGAEFTLSGEFADGTDPLVWTSGDHAEAVAGKLIASTAGDERVYTLEETGVPQHYLAAPSLELKMDAEGALYQRAPGATAWSRVEANALTVLNSPVRGHVTLTKTVADDGVGTVAGVEFSLYKAGADGADLLVAAGLATDADGAWTSVGKDSTANPDTGQMLDQGLAVGSYYFVETAATPDTVLDGDARHEFEIADGNHYATTNAAVACGAKNKAFSASLKLDKLDGTSGEALAGAEFELMYTPEGGGAAQTVPLTVEGGTFKATDLKKGSYALEETRVPTGYEGAGAFKATFELADADDGLELAIGEGAATSAGPVDKASGAWTSAGVLNERILGSMSLDKVAAGTEAGLEGALFRLTGPDGYVADLATDAGGELSATHLAWGDYTLTEAKAPAGYRLGAEPYSAAFAIGAQSLAVDLGSVENTPTEISVAKVDNLDAPNPVSGARLKLSGTFADGKKEKEWVADGTLKNFKTLLVVGEEYALTEDGAVAGYEPLPGSVVFKLMEDGKIELLSNPVYADGTPAAVLDDGNVVLSVRNMRLPGTVELVKVDADDANAPLDGAVFGLFDADGDAKLGEFATGRAYTGADDAEGASAEPGSLSIAGLEWGGYYLQELSSDGYVIPDTRYPFSIGAGTPGMTADLGQVANERTKASFSKVDAAEGGFVAGATLTLSGRFANPEADEVSWTSGTGAFNLAGRLVAGEAYELAETARPDGYLALPGPVELAVGSDGKLSVMQNPELADGRPAVSVAADGTSLSLRNVEVSGSVELVKSDAAGSLLEGISFELHKGLDGRGGLVQGGLVTGVDGKVSVAGLPEGGYAFVETATRDDLILDPNPVPVSIGTGDHGTTVSVAMENKAFSASLVLHKLDGATGDALEGAEFELAYVPEGGGDKRVVPMTVEGGAFKATDLKKGSYALAETKVPTGYEGAGAFKATFELADADDGLELAIGKGAATSAGPVDKAAGAWTSAGVLNERILGSMSLAKVAAGTETGLEGAEFRLAGPDGYVADLATDADGKLSVGDLAWGEYSLVEAKAPAGYRLGAEPYSAAFAIGAQSLAVDLGSVENAKTSISIAKTDDDGGPLAGARLKLSGTFADGTTETEWTSEADARVFEGALVAGEEYTLTETGRLSGYRTWSGHVSFKLDDAGKVVLDDPADPAATVSADGLRLSLSNTRIVANVELTKTRDGVGPLEGVTFDLYAEGADEPLERGLVTDAAGKVRVSGLPEGSYYFVETAAPDDAVADGAHQAFSIGEQDHGKTVAVVMDNSSFTTVVSLLKVDQTSAEALAGAQFALSKQAADGSFVPVGSPLATNEHGAAAFVLTEKGTYRIQETQAAPGYVLDADKPYTATFTVENTAAFQDAELKLAEVVDPATAGAYGLVVENARYEGGKVANERKLGSVALTKVAAGTDEGLAGAEFELTGPDGSVATVTTGADGSLSVAPLAWGAYTVTETKAPDGYRLGAQPYSKTFEIGAGNADSTPSVDLGTVGNEPIEVSFAKLERYVESCSDASLGAAEADATRPLEGAEFTAYDDEACTRVSRTAGGEDLRARSGADGAVSFSPVTAGTYYLKETVVPAGHVPSDAVHRLDVAVDGTVERFAPLGEDGVLDAVVNDVHRTDIRIKKVSENDEGKVLPNSTYGLFKRVAAPEARAASAFPGESGLQLVAKATTGADGYLVFEGVLMDREYVIQELEAPDGSLVSKHPIALTFAVGDDGAPRLVSFDDGSGTAEVDESGDIVWKEPQVIVEFSKRDPDGALLAGATLQVVDEAGATVGEPWVSEADAGRRIEGVLVAGETYRLVELAAPDGYAVAEDVAFTVENPKLGPQEGYVQHVEMVDERVPEAPAKPSASRGPFGFLAKTGDAPLGLLAVGATLAAAGIAASVGVRRRRRS